MFILATSYKGGHKPDSAPPLSRMFRYGAAKLDKLREVAYPHV